MATPIEKLAIVEFELNRIIRGKADVIRHLLTAFVAGGNVLLDDVPGVGKTTLAKALARLVDAKFSRIQFTPDLLPADITGTSIYNPGTGKFPCPDFFSGGQWPGAPLWRPPERPSFSSICSSTSTSTAS